jgi:predicted DNA binding CopG/RHH family protein
MNDDQSEQLDLILPAGMLAEINTRAAKRGLEPADLIDQVLEQARRESPAYWQQMMAIVRAVDDALALDIPAPWPQSFEDRLFVGVLLSMWQKQSSETLLLETNGSEMVAIEEICRAEGISYEEFTRKAIDAKLHGENLEQEDGHDEADWWKQ